MPSTRTSAETAARQAAAPILSARELCVDFKLEQGWVRAVDGVSFDVRRGEVLGIVGESGSGKSQILMAAMGLTAANGRCSGSVTFEGEEVLNATPDRLDRIRGSSMSMIFQDPMTSLNPYMRVVDQLTEVLVAHQGKSRAEAVNIAVEMLERVRIPDARRRISLYPHEFSGGMRQRVMIAMALLCRPALLFADEPTTALDVTVQAQILDLLNGLVHELNAAVVIVTHDLGVIARLCDRVIVLYGGRIMEEAAIGDLFTTPHHPYTQGLLAATPRLDDDTAHDLRTIPGTPRALAGQISGCPFAPRCERRMERCTVETPTLRRTTNGKRAAACHLVTA
ncbi:ABC transporter ATP-binding protein [Dongia deserti]|uniref:ABC transporter ATP-binding protein n=1 Tax=Dongia deserti TaxID=2268030 RepID=UPI000E654D57|nr:ABC transporter ATP-binding protein [Dongia deserti]